MEKKQSQLETISKFEGDLNALAEVVANLSYGSLALFLAHLNNAILAQQLADQEAGKVKLADKLRHLHLDITCAHYSCTEVWKFCEEVAKKE